MNRKKRKSRALSPKVLDYIFKNRPHKEWVDIAIMLDREGMTTVRGKKWTGGNLKCAFERYAATFSPYSDLI